jgi:hypothetical protein
VRHTDVCLRGYFGRRLAGNQDLSREQSQD